MSAHNMKTLSQVIETLKNRGIVDEFRLNENNEMYLGNGTKGYQPQELSIRKAYRFEGDSSADDNAVLYVIEDAQGNLGIIIDSYGAESNYDGSGFDNFLRSIPVDESDEYNID